MDNPQWSMSMNPAFYANTPNSNVDWAQLAAQWIHMRETLPPDQLSLFPDAPPPPTISLLDHSSDDVGSRLQDEEKGEAPMEVEKDDDDMIPGFDNVIHQSVPMIAPQPPLIPQWNSAFGGNNVTNTNSGTWRNPAWQMFEATQPVSQANTAPPLNKPPPLCPELQGYTTSRKRWANRSPNRDAFVTPIPVQTTEDNNDEDETLDAAKRKTLPAWIREGLEKMEREKQREEERIKMEELRKKRAEERRKLEEEALNELESTKGLRSKFVSDLTQHRL